VSVRPARSLDRIFELLVQTDSLIAKAASISEVAQIARIETRLREYLEAQWNKVKREAIGQAVRLAVAGKPASQISAIIINRLNKWEKVVEQRFKDSITEIYQKSRIASYRKGIYRSGQDLTYDTPNFESVQKASIPKNTKILPMFDVVDERAAKALEGQHTFWIKDHVDRNLAPSIRDTVKKAMIEAGKGRVEAGRILREQLTKELGQVRTPGGWNGTQRQYFEGLAANAATTARAQGNIRSFTDLGITKYQIENPQDERTCKVCMVMDGKIFTVKQGMDVIDKEMSANSPDDVKEAHPWYSEKQLNAITTGPGNQGKTDADVLAAKGYAVPPFHFRCRCAVTVTEESGGFNEVVETPPTPPSQRKKEPNWKPTMSSKEANAYVQDSKIKDRLFTRAVASVVSRVGLIAEKTKKLAHSGITLMGRHAAAAKMAEKGSVITVMVKVKNPLRTSPEFWDGKSVEPAHVSVYEKLPRRVKPAKATAGQLSEAAQKAGYDGWYVPQKGKISELRVFDKKQVVITKL